MSQSKEFMNPDTLMKPGSYSHVVKVKAGTTVYIAGQVPCDIAGNIVGEGDFEAQVEQVFRNLKAAVEAAGGSLADLVKMNVYLVESVPPEAVVKFRALRERHFDVQKLPASTLVVVNRLARPGWLVEIEAVVALDG